MSRGIVIGSTCIMMCSIKLVFLMLQELKGFIIDCGNSFFSKVGVWAVEGGEGDSVSAPPLASSVGSPTTVNCWRSPRHCCLAFWRPGNLAPALASAPTTSLLPSSLGADTSRTRLLRAARGIDNAGYNNDKDGHRQSKQQQLDKSHWPCACTAAHLAPREAAPFCGTVQCQQGTLVLRFCFSM